MPKVMIIEDERDIGDLIKTQLESAGLETEVARSGGAGKEAIESGKNFDLYIIDWMLPEVSGIELCQLIRSKNATMQKPVIMVTALTQSENIIQGLEAGADDYITKPFDMDVLIARVRAQLRRGNATPASEVDEIEHDGFKINYKKCQVSLNDEPINLTNTEYQILTTLSKDPGCVFTREQLISQILGDNVHVTNRTIDTHMAGLRKKLKEASKLIETIRGIGYRFHDINS